VLHVNHEAQQLKYALDRKAYSMEKYVRKDTDSSWSVILGCWSAWPQEGCHSD